MFVLCNVNGWKNCLQLFVLYHKVSEKERLAKPLKFHKIPAGFHSRKLNC